MAPAGAGDESIAASVKDTPWKDAGGRSYCEVVTGRLREDFFEEWPVTGKWADQTLEEFGNRSESEFGENEWNDTRGNELDSDSKWRDSQKSNRWGSDGTWSTQQKSKKLCENKRWQTDEDQGVRRTICWFWQKGTCKRMNGQCCFAHGEHEIGTVAPPIQSEDEIPDQIVRRTLCKFWQQGNCEKAAGQCGFAHGEHEIGSHAPAETKSICRFHAAGHCRSGTSCPFIHAGPAVPALSTKDAPESQERSRESIRRRRFDANWKGKHATSSWISAPVNSEVPAAGSDIGSDTGSVTGNTTIDTPLASVASELPACSAAGSATSSETGSITPQVDSKRNRNTDDTPQLVMTPNTPSAPVASEAEAKRKSETNGKVKSGNKSGSPMASVASVTAQRCLDTNGKLKNKSSRDKMSAPVAEEIDLQKVCPSSDTSSVSVVPELDSQELVPEESVERQIVKTPHQKKRSGGRQVNETAAMASNREVEPQTKKAKNAQKSAKKSKGRPRTAEESPLINVSLLFLATFTVTILACIAVRHVRENPVDSRQIIAGLGWSLVLVAAPAAYFVTAGAS